MTSPACTIRAATAQDLATINRIYNHEVESGVATWELDPWPEERRREWFAARGADEPVTVAVVEGAIAGFAYLTRYRGRRGYRFTRENSVFVAPERQRSGIGRALLGDLVERARALGVHALVAWIDVENAGSIALHRAFGYRVIGAEHETGHKFGAWRSSIEMQIVLDRPLPGPGE